MCVWAEFRRLGVITVGREGGSQGGTSEKAPAELRGIYSSVTRQGDTTEERTVSCCCFFIPVHPQPASSYF